MIRTREGFVFRFVHLLPFLLFLFGSAWARAEELDVRTLQDRLVEQEKRLNELQTKIAFRCYPSTPHRVTINNAGDVPNVICKLVGGYYEPAPFSYNPDYGRSFLRVVRQDHRYHGRNEESGILIWKTSGVEKPTVVPQWKNSGALPQH